MTGRNDRVMTGNERETPPENEFTRGGGSNRLLKWGRLESGGSCRKSFERDRGGRSNPEGS